MHHNHKYPNSYTIIRNQQRAIPCTHHKPLVSPTSRHVATNKVQVDPAITWQLTNLQVDPAITWQIINLPIDPTITWQLIQPPGKPGHHVEPNKPPGKPGHHVAPNNLRLNLTITWRLIQSFPYSHVLSQQYHIRVIPQNLKVHF